MPFSYPNRLFVDSTCMPLTSVLSLRTLCNNSLRATKIVTTAGLVSAWVLTCGIAQADPASTAEVVQLLEQGKLSEAAQRAQKHLKSNANDVQMRFLQGVIAAEQRKYDQAIQLFTTLTQDYPGLPEPYNNLAVLYAAKGEERKAAQVLEQAIRTNPSYATAHENLGDLYARMASDAYAKALQLDSNRQAIQPKLALIKQIFPVAAAHTATANTVATTTTASPPAAAPTPAAVKTPAPVAAKPEAQPATPPSAVIAASPAAAVAQPKTNTNAPAPAVQAAAATPSLAQAESSSPQALTTVKSAVTAWSQAWARQDMAAYYAAYSDQFQPQGSTLAAWKTERKERIVGKPTISVEVRDLKVKVQGTQATANFRQFYASGGYKATTRKTLRLQQEGEKWRIIREETGS